MVKYFIKTIQKKHKNLSEPKAREAYGKFACQIGIITNIMLTLIKVIIGLLSNSIALIADGINNLSDASSSIISLIGFKLASAPEDEEHPYGHARIEYITGIIVSFLIVVVGLLLLQTSFLKILNPEDLSFSYLTIILIFIAIIVKLWQMFFYRKFAELINSQTLKATSIDSRNDVFSSVAIFISMIIWEISGINIDGIIGTLVALFIIWSGIKLIKETSSPLLGETPSTEVVGSINSIAKSYDAVLGVHDIVIHNYGPSKAFATFHVEVDGDDDIFYTHNIVDIIERRIKNELNIECTIHLDPVKVNDPLIHELSEILSANLLKIDGISDLHDLRIVPGPHHTNVIFDIVKAFNCEMSNSEIQKIAQKKVRDKYPNFYIKITFDIKYT